LSETGRRQEEAEGSEGKIGTGSRSIGVKD